jgi:hypothetical protein
VERSLIVRPPVMWLEDSIAQAAAVFSDEESAILRRLYRVPGTSRTEGWADRLPTVTCPCVVADCLRLHPWPPCPIHDIATKPFDVVQVAERFLAP